VETLRIAKTSTVALADDLNGCKQVRATVQVLPTIVWDGNQEGVNMLPLPLAVFQVRNFLVCGIRHTPTQRFHKFEPLREDFRKFPLCLSPMDKTQGKIALEEKM